MPAVGFPFPYSPLFSFSSLFINSLPLYACSGSVLAEQLSRFYIKQRNTLNRDGMWVRFVREGPDECATFPVEGASS
jgi:hypothetical protein